MTIAVIVKVNDGLVLAADSATTLGSVDPATNHLEVQNIYNNANKVFNLRKGLPIGMMTWGLGNIGPASISSLAKDLRRRMTNGDGVNPALDPDSYVLADVAEAVRAFYFDEKYQPLVATAGTGPGTELGLLVAGYSAGSDLPESYLITMDGVASTGPDLVMGPDIPGASWWGQPEAITRLLNGIDPTLPQALINLGVDPADAGPYTSAIVSQVARQLVSPAMPIQDAIDLARFLVDLTIQFVRFSPGHATVGGPIEIAAITKHEGFKWVARKHYFTDTLNPPERS